MPGTIRNGVTEKESDGPGSWGLELIGDIATRGVYRASLSSKPPEIRGSRSPRAAARVAGDQTVGPCAGPLRDVCASEEASLLCCCHARRPDPPCRDQQCELRQPLRGFPAC